MSKMKKNLIFSLLVLLALPSCNKPTSKLDQLAALVENNLYNNIVPFWVNNAVDNINGGFFGTVDSIGVGNPESSKGVILNARILWTFSALHLKDKDAKSLEMARRAYEYLTAHFIDQEYGGAYYTVDNLGNAIADNKNTYANAFVIYGLSEYHRATGDPQALEYAISVFTALDNVYDAEYGGYLDGSYLRDWSPAPPRGGGNVAQGAQRTAAQGAQGTGTPAAQGTQGAQRTVATPATQGKSMNTSLHVMEALANLYRVWKSPLLESRLQEMITIFLDKVINPETHLQHYTFAQDWTNRSNTKSYGHDIECSWLLLESAEILGKQDLIERSKVACLAMAEAVAKDAIYPNGRMIYDVRGDEEPSPFVQWWAQAEAVVGCVNAWQLSGDEVWLDRALLVWQFTDDIFVDHQYGEWYYDIDRNDVLRTGAPKADAWKCPYHNGRMCMEVIHRAAKVEK